jgi:hypothetical protein
MRKPSKRYLIDGVEKIGNIEAAMACGTTPVSFSSYVHLHAMDGVALDFKVKGHRVQSEGKSKKKLTVKTIKAAPVQKKAEPKEIPLPVEVVSPAVEVVPPREPTPAELLALELRSVKEELRYLRECLLGRFHGLDEISEHVRSIETRVIESKKVHGSFTAGNYGTEGLGAEKLG